MVLIKNSVKSFMVPLAVGSLMVIPGCKKDEPAAPSKTDLLVGDWIIEELDSYDYTQSPNELYLFKFTRAGDWQFCYEYVPDTSQNYCYLNGKWRWNSAETSITIDQIVNAPSITYRVDVVILDANRLEGTLTTDYSANSPIKFRKAN